MNYQYLIPGSQGNTSVFIADSTGMLGNIDKGLDDRVWISVDYSKIFLASTITSYSFRVSPGGEPQLLIGPTATATNSMSLDFFISGGIGGQQYQLLIVVLMANGVQRTDILNVNVFGDSCGCVVSSPISPVSVFSDGSTVIVNTSPRFFVSATPPMGANVLDRWYSTSDGNTYDYITDGLRTYWKLE